MSSLNKVQLIGNLGQDPEIRSTQSGDKVATLSIATSESWRDKNTGEKREKTEWHRVVAFGNLAGIMEQYLKKGSKVYLEGQMQTRKWQDQSGQDRYTTEVVLSGFGGKMMMLSAQQQQRDTVPPSEGSGHNPPEPPTHGLGRDLDDEVPF